jgi:hypothetical protein
MSVVMLGVEEESCKVSRRSHVRGRRGVMLGVTLGVEEESCKGSC